MCLDEADRMVDGGFEEEMRDIMSFFKVRVCVCMCVCQARVPHRPLCVVCMCAGSLVSCHALKAAGQRHRGHGTLH